MRNLDLQRLLEPSTLLDPQQVVLTLALALGLSLVVALVYRLSVPGCVLSPTMQSSLVLLAMVAAMVMMVIGNNLARAFSLVGALAIVRFRTRLRSPWDISFVFFSLATGIGCGVMAYQVAILGTVMISLAVLALHVIPLAGIRPENLRYLRCDVGAFEGVENRLEQVLDDHVARRWLVEARSQRFGESLSFRYRVVVRDPDNVAPMMRAISGIEGVERVVLDLSDENQFGE
jgi:hypothetical protein